MSQSLCVSNQNDSDVNIEIAKLFYDQGCDDVLKSVEQYLSKFQADLGVVSAEIEHLQSRSMQINRRLDNRVAVEKLLGPAVEELSISPAIVKKIYEGPVDAQWALAITKIEEHEQALKNTSQDTNKVKAREDISPLLTNLINKVMLKMSVALFGMLISCIRPLR